MMAPVGGFDSLEAAIKAGADSVFFGVRQLNMRARSSHNFEIEEMRDVAERCSEAGIKCYVTMNTLLYEHDMALMRRIIDEAKACGVSAIIVQDMAAVLYARQVGMPIQASTQLSISNFEAVRFYSQFADTVVLAREVDLDMIKGICDRIVEEDVRGPSGELVRIEVFVHGALCIAQAGRCQMSLLQFNTSAQRGACLQECRKQYRVYDDETGKEMMVGNNGYIFSPKDLCSLPFLDRIVATGVSVLKIEGRARSPRYVDTVVRVYREAVDAIEAGSFSLERVDEWMKRLEAVFNRGFTDGYYLGQMLPDWSSYSKNRSTLERVYVGRVHHYYGKAGVAELNVEALEIAKGDNLVIMGDTTGVVYDSVREMRLDDEVVVRSGKGLVTMPICEQVRRNDKVYLLKKRDLDVFA